MLRSMPVVERRIDRGSRIATEIHLRLARELREERIAAGLSQRRLARAAGITHSSISRIEAGRAPATTIKRYAQLFALLGNRLTMRVHPEGSPLKDAAQLRTLDRLRPRVHPSVRHRTEVLIGTPGDLRSWDMALDTADGTAYVDSESILSDLQGLERRLAAKQRDSGAAIVILLVARTARNLAVLRAHGHVLRVRFPVDSRTALRLLGDGQLPKANALIVV